jgi:rhodanese-related sulfurtransferase
MALFPDQPDDDFKQFVYEQFSRVGKILSSPQRLIILNILCQGEHTVEALAKYSELTLANVSQHLQLLKSVNMIKSRKEGKYSFYKLTDESTCRFFTMFREYSVTRLPEIQATLDKLTESPSRSDLVSMSELMGLVEKGTVYVIDVRPREEYEANHLPGAVSAPLDELSGLLETLPKDRDIVAYCRSEFCILADKAVDLLTHNGFKARRMDVGLIDWMLAGFPLDK